MMPEIIRANFQAARDIASKMRGVSVNEVKAFGIDPLKTVENAINKSRYSWAGYLDGEIVCLWGIQTGSILSSSAMLWLITTPMVEQHPFYFVRRSQIFVQELITKEYDYLYGYVRHDFKKSISWLRWLGFVVKRPDKNGICLFELRR